MRRVTSYEHVSAAMKRKDALVHLRIRSTAVTAAVRPSPDCWWKTGFPARPPTRTGCRAEKPERTAWVVLAIHTEAPSLDEIRPNFGWAFPLALPNARSMEKLVFLALSMLEALKSCFVQAFRPKVAGKSPFFVPDASSPEFAAERPYLQPIQGRYIPGWGTYLP